MSRAAGGGAPARAHEVHRELVHWLNAQALPVWASQGFDERHGCFQERLTPAGPVPGDARRARVQVRQVYVFANAPALGWPGPAAALVAAGLGHFLRHYRRSDGLFRTLCAADGMALDERAFLYDQAFVLLALAESRKVLGARADLAPQALGLLDALRRLLRRTGPGFESGLPERTPLLANPHMHLLEAALAWCEAGQDPGWRALVEEITALALTRLIDPASGALLERFGEDWRPLPVAQGQVVEPGHLFEWSWLLQRVGGAAALAAARRLVELGERHGVRGGVVLNELNPDLTLHDPGARLWPQTERLKANARLAVRAPEHWPAALEAAQALQRYLAGPAPGLWHDRLSPAGQFLEEPAPASSLYHIVCAIAEFGAALAVDAG